MKVYISFANCFKIKCFFLCLEWKTSHFGVMLFGKSPCWRVIERPSKRTYFLVVLRVFCKTPLLTRARASQKSKIIYFWVAHFREIPLRTSPEVHSEHLWNSIIYVKSPCWQGLEHPTKVHNFQIKHVFFQKNIIFCETLLDGFQFSHR